MPVTINHAKTNNIPDPTQAELDAQIALGNYPIGTTLADIALASDWNNNHVVTGGEALTRTNDTNVTLTLGGTPATALLQATSITVGWSGTLAETRGGTGQGTYAQGDILYSPATNTLAKLAKDTNATRYLSNTGTSNNPAWAQVNLANGVTGDLPFSNIAQLAANSVFANPTTATADGQAVTISANNILGRITGGNVGGTPVGFGLSFDATSLRINLAETKFGWLGDHTFLDNNFRLNNPAATFQYYFRTSAISAARDVTLPVLASNDTFVFEAHTQSMSNKTITASTINSTQIGNTTPAAANFGSTTNYWSFNSSGVMTPVGTALYGVPLDYYAFIANGTAAGLFFRAFTGVTGYAFFDLFGGDIASIDVAGTESFIHSVYGFSTGVGTPAQLTANTNNYALLATPGGIERISSNADINITGIGAPVNAGRGAIKTLRNIGSFNITLTHADTASLAANRFDCPSALPFVIPPGGNVDIYYDYTSALWIVKSDANSTAGTYTPTLTNVTNLAASTAYQCQFMRIGNTVTVSGRVDVDPTAIGATALGISLPIASNFGATEDCAGTAFASGIAGQGAAIRGDAANNRAEMAWVTGDITNQPMYFTFTYQVI